MAILTIGKLKKLIKNMDDDLVLICQKDGEGNGYSPLAGLDDDNNLYLADSTYSGVVGPAKLTKALKDRGFTEEDLESAAGGIPCAVLYPIN